MQGNRDRNGDETCQEIGCMERPSKSPAIPVKAATPRTPLEPLPYRDQAKGFTAEYYSV